MESPLINKSLDESEQTQLNTEKNSLIAKDEESGESSRAFIPIVGVGASAGGLEAFTALLQHLPKDTGMAFVLVQHLSPTHKSMLSELLGKKSAMPVTEATNGVEVAANHVYVIPPNVCMSIMDGFLHLRQRSESHEQNLPIDFFLCSLAEYQKDKAIAVILSGTASDGSLGVKVVKGYGGITFAQDETAKFDMMPKNAIATGSVDFVLSPEGIAKELITFSRHPSHGADSKLDELIPEADNLRQILMLLCKASGIDFTNYKPTTIKRRILRRMMLKKINNLKDYVNCLVSDPKEIQTLSHEVFITVTRFFRDPETFQALQHDVFAPLVKSRPSHESIRIWTTGCSTGEEAYSLAINLIEFLEKQDNANVQVQIFATDIMVPSIEHARLGIYAENITNDVSPERLKKFFRKIDKGYQINKSIRDMCVFAKQNIIADPPFSKLDLISCRNLLIYLDSVAQKRIMPILHYALNPGGFLLLGQSESVVAFPELFKPVNRKAKIYSKNPVQKMPLLAFSRTASSEMSVISKPTQANAPSVADIQKEADRIVLKTVQHSGVVISEAMEVIQFRGDTSRYLKHVSGTASLNLLKMVPEGLFVELRNAILKATKINTAVKTQSIRITNSRDTIDVLIKVIPFRVPTKTQRYFLIVFEEPAAVVLPESESKSGVKTKETPSSDKNLQEELESTRAHLQGVIDDKEAANEEILSTNEELQSLNEEFQSANEELESAKEELQATNEEITTLNDELQSRNIQLAGLNDDLINLMESINLPLITVGRDLRIRRFTPTAGIVLRLIQSDIGRPITDLKSDIDLQDLDAMMLQAINTGALKEIERKSHKDQWYKIQVRPFKTIDNKIDGAVLTFFDVTKLKEFGLYREAIFQTMREPFIVLNAVLRVKFANKSFYEKFHVKPEDTVGELFFSLGNDQWNIPTLRTCLEEIIPKKKKFSDYEVSHDFPHIGQRTMLINAAQIQAEEDGEDSILLTIEDITEHKQRAFLSTIVEASDDAIISKDLNGIITSWNKSAQHLFGYTAKEAIGQTITMLIPTDRIKEESEILKRLKDGEHITHYETLRVRKDGSLVEVSLTMSPIKDVEGCIVGASKIASDITERRQVEKKLREAEEHFRFMAEAMPQKIFTAGPDGKKNYFNQQWKDYIGPSFEKKNANWTQFIHPDDKEETLMRWKHSIETGEAFEFQNRFLRADGVYRWHLNRANALCDAQGKVRMWIGSNTEIDDQKRTEEHLKHYAEKLARSNKDLEQFALISSHDLQEPLSIIANYIDLLRKKYKDKFDETGQQFTEHIVESVSRMQTFIGELLAYSQVGRENKFKEVDMENVCSLAIKNLAMKIKESGAKVTCDKLPRMIADETLTVQLFQNLISNAIKFRNPKLPPRVDISAKSQEDDWIFSVKDNGIGIAPENQGQIFEIFKRLHSQHEYSGTGIGLAFCKRIVESHGGRIWLESEYGKGTIFFISFPLVKFS